MLWENSSAAVAAVVVARFFLDKFSKKNRHFQSFLMKMTFCVFIQKVVFENIFELFSPLAGGSRVEQQSRVEYSRILIWVQSELIQAQDTLPRTPCLGDLAWEILPRPRPILIQIGPILAKFIRTAKHIPSSWRRGQHNKIIGSGNDLRNTKYPNMSFFMWND